MSAVWYNKLISYSRKGRASALPDSRRNEEKKEGQKRMKILSITAQKPHSTGSGVYLTELVKNWAEAGHEQSVVGGVYKEDQVDFPGRVKFYPVFYHTETLPFAIAGMSDEMPYESTRYREFTSDMLERFREIFCRTIEDAVRELNPDLIVCHHLYLLTAMVREWYPEKKVIAICHGSDLRQIEKNPLEREYIRERIRKLDGVIALHREQKKEIRRIFEVQEAKIKVVGVGYNDRIFFQISEKKERTGPFQIIFAGKISEKKGVCSLLRALSDLPYREEQLKVVLAGGHGPEAEYREIRRLAADCRYPVSFPGLLSQRELADYFRQSDVFVLPSFFEGLALVNIEAMACGCKVVCSDLPGMAEWFCEHVPGENIDFVTLPTMENTDEPRKEELPEFERRLAKALIRKLEQREEEHPVLSEI